MKRIGITQRVVTVETYAERRDALDQRWTPLLLSLGLVPVPIPNALPDVATFLQHCALDGIILSGGNSPSDHGGDAPERDKLELDLLRLAMARNLPLLAVCRGMQMLQLFLDGELEAVHGHVTKSLPIIVNGAERKVNSYHNLAFRVAAPPLQVWALAKDGVVKAVRHPSVPIVGIMWHPERQEPADTADLQLIRELFGEN